MFLLEHTFSSILKPFLDDVFRKFSTTDLIFDDEVKMDGTLVFSFFSDDLDL